MINDGESKQHFFRNKHLLYSAVEDNLIVDDFTLLLLFLQVWVTFQDNIIHYLKNSLLLPLVIRSNRTISKYFVGYDTTISCLKFDGR